MAIAEGLHGLSTNFISLHTSPSPMDGLDYITSLPIYITIPPSKGLSNPIPSQPELTPAPERRESQLAIETAESISQSSRASTCFPSSFLLTLLATWLPCVPRHKTNMCSSLALASCSLAILGASIHRSPVLLFLATTSPTCCK